MQPSTFHPVSERKRRHNEIDEVQNFEDEYVAESVTTNSRLVKSHRDNPVEKARRLLRARNRRNDD